MVFSIDAIIYIIILESHSSEPTVDKPKSFMVSMGTLLRGIGGSEAADASPAVSAEVQEGKELTQTRKSFFSK